MHMLHRFRKKSLRMGSILLFFFLQNVLVFGLIFWLLTWLTE